MLTKWDNQRLTNPQNRKRGSSIIEIIVAIGIFTLVAGNIVVLYLGAYSTSLRYEERLVAQMLLQEGLTATTSISNYNYQNLTNGTFGLTDSNGYWELSGGGDTVGQYSRTIQIADAGRSGGSLINNSDCTILIGGGQTDTFSKLVTVTVSWDLEDGNTTSLQGTEYLTDWRDQEGCGASSWLHPDTSSAYLTEDKLSIGSISLNNTASGSITISSVTPTWTNGAMLEIFSINGQTIWESNDDPEDYTPQLSSGSQVAANISINAGSSISIDDMSFSSSMEDEPITFWIVMSDGTARYFELNETPGTPPPPPPPPPPPAGNQADDLSIDIYSARLISRYKKLIGTVLENTGSSDITIDKITVYWAWASNGTKIRRIWLDGDEIWSHNEPYGTVLDVDDFTLEPGEQYPLEALFSKDMWYTLVMFEFTMEDGTTTESDVIWAF